MKCGFVPHCWEVASLTFFPQMASKCPQKAWSICKTLSCEKQHIEAEQSVWALCLPLWSTLPVRKQREWMGLYLQESVDKGPGGSECTPSAVAWRRHSETQSLWKTKKKPKQLQTTIEKRLMQVPLHGLQAARSCHVLSTEGQLVPR